MGFALPKIFLWIGNEFGSAAGRAEIITVPAMLGAVLGTVRVDRHAANGVEDARCTGRSVIVRVCRWFERVRGYFMVH